MRCLRPCKPAARVEANGRFRRSRRYVQVRGSVLMRHFHDFVKEVAGNPLSSIAVADLQESELGHGLCEMRPKCGQSDEPIAIKRPQHHAFVGKDPF
jgi:hypothetical protein